MPQFQGSCKQNISKSSRVPGSKPYLFPAHTLTLLPVIWNFPQTTPNLFLAPPQYDLFWFFDVLLFLWLSSLQKAHPVPSPHLCPGCSCLPPLCVLHALSPPQARVEQDDIVELGTTGIFHRILKDSVLWLPEWIQKSLKLLIYWFVVFVLKKRTLKSPGAFH